MGVFMLDMQSVHSGDDTRQLLRTLQQRREVGDLVALLGHILLHRDGSGSMVDAGEQMDSGATTVTVVAACAQARTMMTSK